MLHVLLVEDNPGDVLMIREAIRTSNLSADVIVAYDGEEALRVLNDYNFEPHIIFLDLNVPKFNGNEILERSSLTEKSPVVVFTSSTNPADNKRAFDLGVRDYIVKPSDLTEYLRTVRAALERWTDGRV